MPQSLRSRIILLVMTILVPALALVVNYALQQRAQALLDRQRQAEAVTQMLVGMQQNLIEDLSGYLRHLASLRVIQNPKNPACSRYLASLLGLHPSIVNLGVPLTNGDLVCNALRLNRKINVADRGYIQQTFRTRDFSIGTFQHDRAAERISVNFAYPVINPKTDELIGAVVAVISLDWWSRQLESEQLPEGSYALIVDSENRVVAEYPQTLGLIGKPIDETGLSVSTAHASQITRLDRTADGIRRMVSSAPLFDGRQGPAATVVVAIPVEEALARANASFFRQLAFLLLTVGVILAIALKMLRKGVLDPIAELQEATTALEAGELRTLNSRSMSRELAALQRRFEMMAAARLAAETEVRRYSEKLDTLFNALPDLFFHLAADGTILDYRAQRKNDLYLPPEQFLGRRMTEVLPEPVSQLFAAHLAAPLESGEVRCFEYSLPINGTETSFEARMSGIPGANERILLVHNISEKKAAEERIWRQAHYDSLTGLANRNLFFANLEQALHHAGRSRMPLALMLVDLDEFKEVNDTLGHDQGDLLLREAARRLRSVVRSEDTIARIGGDEFTILLTDLPERDAAERVASKLLDALAEPYTLAGEKAWISASIGIAIGPEDGSPPEALLKAADQAMYAAKRAGRNRFQYFAREMQDEALQRLRLIADLRLAIEENQFELWYQPVVHLASGSLRKAEALIRWHHPRRGLLPPAAFIEVAESSGLIIPIGQWVFEQALREVPPLRQQIHPDFQLSINASPLQFTSRKSQLHLWPEKLRAAGPGGSECIVTEITEGLLMEASPQVQEYLIAFRDAGIQVAIDDFGTGYSSLAYLHKYDIDYLKIDRSFVSELAPGSHALALCEAIIVMAHKLGLEVIAEGIETPEQEALLRAAGCDFGQGYLYARPAPLARFLAWAQERQDA